MRKARYNQKKYKSQNDRLVCMFIQTLFHTSNTSYKIKVHRHYKKMIFYIIHIINVIPE